MPLTPDTGTADSNFFLLSNLLPQKKKARGKSQDRRREQRQEKERQLQLLAWQTPINQCLVKRLAAEKITALTLVATAMPLTASTGLAVLMNHQQERLAWPHSYQWYSQELPRGRTICPFHQERYKVRKKA
jgi:hypothetical protein